MKENNEWIETIAVLGKIKKRKIKKLAKRINKAIRSDNEVHDELRRSLPRDVSFKMREDFLGPYPQFNPDTLLAYFEIKLGEEEKEDVRLAIKWDGSIVLEREIWTRGASFAASTKKPSKEEVEKSKKIMSWTRGDKNASCLQGIINGQQHC